MRIGIVTLRFGSHCPLEQLKLIPSGLPLEAEDEE